MKITRARVNWMLDLSPKRFAILSQKWTLLWKTSVGFQPEKDAT